MSMKSICMGVMATVLAALLGACSQAQQQSGAVSSAGGSTQSAAPSNTNSAAGASLKVTPATVDGCKPNQPIIATVSWNSAIPKVKVMVSGPNHAAPQLFSESGYTGSAKTGNWVVENTQFTLVDEKSGNVLTTYTVGSTPCSK